MAKTSRAPFMRRCSSMVIPRLFVWSSGSFAIRSRVIWRPVLPCEQTHEKSESPQLDGTYSSPDNHPAWHLPFDTIRAFENNILLVHLLHHRLCEDLDLRLLERALGIGN